MTKVLNVSVDEVAKEKSETFINSIRSDMYYKSELITNTFSFDWLDEVEFVCPYLDNIVRNPKVALIKEEDVVKVEKARKTSVETIKDLSKHTHYIEEINERTNEVRPKKLLITRHEETYNTYENRFIYTLIIDKLERFITIQERLFNDLETKDDKALEYAASAITGMDKVNIELRIGAKKLPEKSDEFAKEIETVKSRIKKIQAYFGSWHKSQFMQSLENENVHFVIPPIRKTNVILKNPNFQFAMKLWDYLNKYDDDIKSSSKEGIDTAGNNILRGILDDSFLMDYFVLDSISSTKKEQKEKLTNYAIIMLNRQIQRAVSLLLNYGVKVSDEELLAMIANQIKSEKKEALIGSNDVRDKFKSAMDEYLKKNKFIRGD